MGNNSLNFLFTINDRYIDPIQLLIYSIEKNNTTVKKEYYFIYDNISEQNQKLIEKYVSGFNSKAYFIMFNWDKSELLIENGVWSREIYYRLFAPYLLPDLDMILYLDGDTIVDSNLFELFSYNINGYALAAVPNDEERRHINRLDNSLNRYYNSGVLLMNLTEIRRQIDFELMKQLVLKMTPKYEFPDQDFINVIFKNKIFELPQKYNYMINLLERKKDYPKLSKFSICHYVLQKPWDYEFPYLTDRKYLLYLVKKGDIGSAVNLWYHHRKYRIYIKLKGKNH